MKNLDGRSRSIVYCSIFGISINMILFIIKIVIASVMHSEAIVLDAMNGLTDSFSMATAIITVFIARKGADRRHPFGYGRIEYLISFVLTVFVIYVGIQGLIHAVTDIFYPGPAPEYNVAAGVVMGISFVLKYVFGARAKKIGTEVRSVTIRLSGIESMHDSMISVIILGAMILYRFTGFVAEYWVSLVFAVMLIKDGVELAIECMNKILGTKVAPEYIRSVKQLILSEDKVLNTSNLIIHDYGEDVSIGSVDIEVDEETTAAEINRITREIKRKVREQGLWLTSIGIIGSSTDDPRSYDIKDRIIAMAQETSGVKRIQGFTVDYDKNLICFAVITDGAVRNSGELMEKFRDALNAEFPEMTVEIETAIDI